MKKAVYPYQGFWDRIANKYAKTPIKDQEAFKALVENIRNYVGEEDTVLDFGCGTGTFSIAIADKVKFIRAADISERMLSIARERAHTRDIHNIEFRHLGIFDRELQPASYNVLLAFNVLHLQQDLDKVLQRIYELLAPGGLLISKNYCVAKETFWLKLLLTPLSKLRIVPYVNGITLADLRTTMRRNRLNILETSGDHTGPMEYFVVARKDK